MSKQHLVHPQSKSLNQNSFRRHAAQMMSRAILLFGILLIPVVGAFGQTSVTDGKTPTGLTPGAPAGSYALSGFENVNLYNGNLSFRLPLLSIGGRGGAGYTMMLPIEQKWIVKKGQTNPSGTTPLTPNPNWWQGKKPRYGPGVMQGRRTGYGEYPFENYCGVVPNVHDQTLTRLTFTAADGTEYELRDQLTNGAPGAVFSVPCDKTGTSRGKVFIAADGSAATFISDAVIYDYKWLDINLSNRLFYPSGDLMLKDGTRYRIDNGEVSWIRDRNGNRVTFGTTIKDSLNRNVRVTLNTGAGYDEIIYSGSVGAERKIRVWYDSLSNRLRPDFAGVQTYYQLFPLNSASTSSTYNPSRVSKVELPDGRFYEFYYNPYGELARVVLPTGGGFEYDWAGGSDVADELIFRYVTERRVYTVAGGTAENKTQYLRDGSGMMEVKTLNAAGTVLLGRSLHYFYGDAFTSMTEDPGRPSAISFSPWKEGREYKTETFDIVSGMPVLKQTVQHTWQQPVAGSTWPLTQAETSSDAKANDPQITETLTTLADTNQVAKQTFSFDRYSNRTDTYEYDYGTGTAGSLVRRGHTDFLTTNPVNSSDYACNPATTCDNSASIANVIHLRSLPAQSQVFDAGGNERARATYEYDKHSDTNHAALVDRSGISGLDSSFGTSYSKRGNLTATTSYILSPSSTVSSFAQYDTAGNVVKTIDGRGYHTTIQYGDCFGSADANAHNCSAPFELSSVSQASYAFATSATNALGHTIYSQFDFSTGRPVDVEDANGSVSSSYYNDSLDRPTQVIRAANHTATPSLKNQTTVAYNDAGRTITVTSDQLSYGDNLLKSTAHYDGLGRTYESRQYENASAYIATRIEFDALGRAYRTSNPFRSGDPLLWTTSGFDALGRVISVTTPDSAVVATSYAGNTVTVTDQAGKKRKSVSDGLGRLAKVYEDPTGLNYLTSYSYDVLDSLTTVNQDTQTRSFVYDSLKRLKSATNPESGTIAYQYDANGNLTQKSDARAIVTTYIYDALNRATSRSYSDGTPAVTYAYDSTTITNGKGRLASVSSSVSSYNYLGYDVLGRASGATQTLGSQSYGVGYGYNLAGSVTSLTYPSGRTVAYNYDQAGRLADKDSQNPAFKGNLGDGVTRTYSSGILYSSLGGMTREKFGTTIPINNKLFYNSRGQLAEIRESTSYTGPTDATWDRGAIINHYSNTCWGMCGGSSSTTSMTDNNGNLKKQEVYVPNNDPMTSHTTWYQQYDYDVLNRLQRVHEFSGNTALDWQQEYVYDRFGNRTIDGNTSKTYGNGVNNAQASVSTATNRLYGPGETDASHPKVDYDAAGNQTKDLLTTNAVGNGTRVYDAENRLTIARDISANQLAAYSYDGDGRRVKRNITGQPEVWQVYGLGGELLAEYGASAVPTSPQKEYGYRNGQLLITAEASVRSNVARAANGGTATAQNYTQDSAYPGLHFQPAYANDGVHYINPPNGDQYWRDEHGLSSWLQVDFNGAKTIDEIDVYTTADYPAFFSEPSATTTFSTQGLSGFNVQYWNGSGWVAVSGGTVTGNNLAWRKFTFAAVTTTKVRVVANAASDSVARICEVEAWGSSAPTAAVNVARAANGGTATAQNYTQDSAYPGLHFQPAYANDGVHYINPPNGDQYWRDEHGLSSWLQVDFNGAKTIDEIDVYTTADYPAFFSEPTATTAFSAQGLSGFNVQYWNGSGWVTVAGGTVTGNNLAWSKFTFAAVTTTKIRVVANAASDGVARICEVEAWTATSGGASASINWLVTDQLGTPRMVFDQSGSLATTKRHDYLPFGEELTAGQGTRTTALGYTGDTVRQKFTQYERDFETGLDYAQARYYGSIMGRFSSADPLHLSGKPALPQSWNRYSYVLNNPLAFIDPSGLIWGRVNGEGAPIWYKDQTAMEAAKATAFTPADNSYEAADGQWVALNPSGPGSQSPLANPYSHRPEDPYYANGWNYTGAPGTGPAPMRGLENKFEHMLFFTSLGQGLFNVAKAGASQAASTAFATESDQAVFWAGREEAKAAATAFATANGGRTIAMTPGGQALSFLDGVPYQVTRPVWNWGSGKFAEGASGNVNVFLNGVAKPTSIWTRTELPTLMRNPKIITIAPRAVP